jgi:hypothetical protein
MKRKLMVMFMSLLVALAAAAVPIAFSSQFHVPTPNFDRQIRNSAMALFEEGKQTFRFDTFGDEAFWGDTLQLHRAVASVSPRTALAVGLKVDSEALPPDVAEKIRKGQVNLDSPETTIALLRLNAVVGVKGTVDRGGALTSIGIQCALCHSTVDDGFAPGIGRRLDGWANRDLNVGAIIALAPDLSFFERHLGVDQATVRRVLNSWGPGKFDAQLLLDGKAIGPDGKSHPTLIPPAFGLAGVNQHTWTGSWGTVSYWNAFVANLEMGGKGTFFDPRLNDPNQFPLAARAGLGNVRNTPDLVTPKLAALHFYQLSIPAPTPPDVSLDRARAGESLFNSKARCAGCHVPPLFTEPGWNLHTPQEIGIDDFQANRAPDKRYRTAPLRGLWTHQKGGFYHDGRFPTLEEVVEHYNKFWDLKLTQEEKRSLIAYLLSL